MTTFDICDSVPRQVPNRSGAFAGLLKAIRVWRDTMEEHRILVELSRRDPHLIRDMGFEPDAVYHAVDGSWDEVRGGRLGGLY